MDVEVAESGSILPMSTLVLLGDVGVGKTVIATRLQSCLNPPPLPGEADGEKPSASEPISPSTVESDGVRPIYLAGTERTLLLYDPPGRRDLFRIAVKAIAHADLAVLVVSARQEELERGLEVGGQTREHALLACGLQVPFLVVVVSHMEDPKPLPPFSEAAFSHAKQRVSRLLSKFAFSPPPLKESCRAAKFPQEAGALFLPMAAGAEQEDGIVMPVGPLTASLSPECADECLKSLLLSIEDGPPQRAARRRDAPTRVSVDAVVRLPGTEKEKGGLIFTGKVLSGFLQKGKRYSVSLGQSVSKGAVCGDGLTERVEVKSLEFRGGAFEKVPAGWAVGFTLVSVAEDTEGKVSEAQSDSTILLKFVKPGSVVFDPGSVPPSFFVCAGRFVARVLLVNHPGEIRRGYNPLMVVHQACVGVRLEDIVAKLDRDTGTVVERDPAFLRRGDSAVIVLVPVKPVFVETFLRSARFGRFVLRDQAASVGIGVVLSVDGRS